MLAPHWRKLFNFVFVHRSQHNIRSSGVFGNLQIIILQLYHLIFSMKSHKQALNRSISLKGNFC